MTPGKERGNDLRILTGLSLGLFCYHMLTAVLSSYGYFIDEFYYIACSKHLAFGYVDHPPLSIFLLALNRTVVGESIPAMRLLPALASAANVFMTGLIARELGGKGGAVVIAALAAIAMPVLLLMGSFYSMNAFEPLIWTGIILLVVKLVRNDNPRYWLAIGLLVGIGLEVKHTMIVYAAALFLGMLLTNARRLLWNRWVLLGALACLLLLLPNIVWQFLNGFPSLEFYRNAMINKNVPRGPLHVILDQILFTNPFALPLWISGLVSMFVVPDVRKYRFFGWTFLVLVLMMVLTRSSRPDRIAAIYPILFAAGAVTIEKLRYLSVQRYAMRLTAAMLVIGTVVAAPIFTPHLPPTELKGYLLTLGVSISLEKGKMNEPIPQWLADRLGWKELAYDVAAVYHSLSPEEQRNAVIISTNYGEAGALDLYAPEFGLPRVFATHNSYHSWGPPPDSTRTFIGVYVSRADLVSRFDSVATAAIDTCADCTRPQQQIPISIARGPRFLISREWANFKIYD
jgi:hypothetical protein